jgi:MFS family permease
MKASGATVYETWLMVLLSVSFGFVFFDRNAMNFLAPFVAPQLHLSNTQVGALSSGFSLAWAMAGFLGGTLSDHLGRRKLPLVIAFVVFSACSFVSGIATSFLMLLGSRILMGLAEGPILPISQSLVALESDESRRGLNMGLMQNFGSNLLGSTVAPLVLVALASAYGWRAAFYVAGIPGLILAVLLWKYIREPQTHEAALIFMGWSASGTFPLFMATIPSETIPARYIATSLGIVMGLGELVGGVATPTAAGWAADRYGLEAPILIEAACAVVATVLAVFLVETAPVKVRARAASEPQSVDAPLRKIA